MAKAETMIWWTMRHYWPKLKKQTMESCKKKSFLSLNYIVVSSFLLQVHDVDQREKWSIHDRQRQLCLPHSKPWVSFPEGSTRPFIKYSAGWGKLLCFLLDFLIHCVMQTSVSWPVPFLTGPLSPPQSPAFHSLPAPSVLSHIIDKGCKTLGERTACFRPSAQPVKDIWLKNDRSCPNNKKKELMISFTLLCLCCLSVAHFTCAVTRNSVLPGVSAGVSDLSPPVIWSSDFYWHVCAVWVTQVPALSGSRWTCISHHQTSALTTWSMGDETEAFSYPL